MYTVEESKHNEGLFNAIDLLNHSRRTIGNPDVVSQLTRTVKYLVDQLICK